MLEPTKAHEPYITSHQSPVTSHQSPVTSHQSPVTSHQSPVTSHQSPVTSHQSPVTSHQSPVTSHQLPVTRHQSPVTSHQSISTLSHTLTETSAPTPTLVLRRFPYNSRAHRRKSHGRRPRTRRSHKSFLLPSARRSQTEFGLLGCASRGLPRKRGLARAPVRRAAREPGRSPRHRTKRRP